jgi:hypothetical protein
MHVELKSADVEMACSDLESRTLANIPGDFARLIYLASTRDYNNGQYHHAGLAHQFSERVAALALASCHRAVFRRLVLCSVSQLADELEAYLRSTHLPLSHVVRAWARLEPFRVAVPLECSPLTARFFAANVTAALGVLRSRQERADGYHPQSAWQRQ